MDTIKDMLAARITQLVVRYLSTGLVALGTYLGVHNSEADVQSCAGVIASFVAAGVGMIIDHYSHALQSNAAQVQLPPSPPGQ